MSRFRVEATLEGECDQCGHETVDDWVYERAPLLLSETYWLTALDGLKRALEGRSKFRQNIDRIVIERIE